MTEDERFDQLLRHWTNLKRAEGKYMDYLCLSGMPRGAPILNGLEPSTYADLAIVALNVMNRHQACMNRLLNHGKKASSRTN